MKEHGSRKWNARYGYGFNLGSRGHRLKGEGKWQPTRLASQDRTVKYLKLHGSLHFDFNPDDEQAVIKLKEKPYTKQRGGMHFAIIPPEWNKTFGEGHFADLWEKATQFIGSATHVVFIGYSLPATDLHSSTLFRTNLGKDPLKSLVVVNPDKDARRRTRDIFQKVLGRETKVLSFDRFEEFVATPRTVWAV